MTSTLAFLEPMFRWVLRTSGEATVIVGLILAIQVLLRNRLAPRWRYSLWLVLVVRLVLPWMPESPASVFNLFRYVPSHKIAAPVNRYWNTLGTERLVVEFTAFAPEATSAQPSVGAANAGTIGLQEIVLGLWLLGAMLFAAHIVLENVRFWRKVRRASTPADARMAALVDRCQRLLGVRTPIRLVATDAVTSPALYGCVRPSLLLPRALAESGDLEALRHVFLHELAHVKRHDLWMNCLTALLQALHWFNPVLWYAFHRMRLDREPACDALALSCLEAEESREYGQTILDILEHAYRTRRVPGMAGILEDRSQLKRRILLIAGFSRRSYRWSFVAALALATAAVLGLTKAGGAPSTSTESEAAPAPLVGRGDTAPPEISAVDTDNAAAVYMQAFDLMTPFRDLATFDLLTRTGRYNAKSLDPYIERNAAALSLLLQAAPIETCDFVACCGGTDSPDLSHCQAQARDLLRIAVVAMTQARLEHKNRRAVNLFTASLRLVDGVHRIGRTIDAMVAWAGLTLLAQQAPPLIASISEQPEFLQRLATSVADVQRTLGDWSVALGEDRRCWAKRFPKPGTVQTRQDLARYADVAQHWAVRNPEPGEVPRDALMTRLIQGTESAEDRTAAAAILQCDSKELATPQGVGDALARYRAELDDLLNELASVSQPVALPRLDQLLAQSEQDVGKNRLLPMYRSVLWGRAVVNTRLFLIRDAIAIVRWRADHGALPASLAELPEPVSNDPFSDGQPFEYQVHNEGSFILRSKGTTRPISPNSAHTIPPKPLALGVSL